MTQPRTKNLATMRYTADLSYAQKKSIPFILKYLNTDLNVAHIFFTCKYMYTHMYMYVYVRPQFCFRKKIENATCTVHTIRHKITTNVDTCTDLA